MAQFDDARRWLQIAAQPDVYTWSVQQDHFFDLRMVAFRLADGTLAVYSPVGTAHETVLDTLSKFGPVSTLVAPNHFHNLGLRPFLARFPAARVVAAAQAIPRIVKVTGLKVEPVLSIAALLPPEVRVVEPAGLRTGELWLLVDTVKPGRILVACDSYFNMAEVRRSAFGAVLWLTGGAPGLRVSRVFRMIGQQKPKVYRDWIGACFREFSPRILIPSHGDIVESDTLTHDLLKLL